MPDEDFFLKALKGLLPANEAEYTESDYRLSKIIKEEEFKQSLKKKKTPHEEFKHMTIDLKDIYVLAEKYEKVLGKKDYELEKAKDLARGILINYLNDNFFEITKTIN